MSPFKSLWMSLRAIFGRRAAESELDEELRIHLEMEIEHNLARGMSPAAARRAARVAFGGVDQTKEASRDAWGWRILPDFGRDTLYALKSLRRSPGFTLIAMLNGPPYGFQRSGSTMPACLSSNPRCRAARHCGHDDHRCARPRTSLARSRATWQCAVFWCGTRMPPC